MLIMALLGFILHLVKHSKIRRMIMFDSLFRRCGNLSLHGNFFVN